ncbi:TIR-like domain protein [Candidatus Magnetomorum sp. HK-1]|nr:TIR-like domain protein [Candidatus Magnetomorum sp. HK-1]
MRKEPSYLIFISYRRHDTAYHTQPIFEKLQKRFGKDYVFLDRESIQPGETFPEKISDALESSKVLIALIEKDWLSIQNQDGEQRLFLEDDYVRIEIKTALSRKIPIIPVLFDNVQMPQKQNLPDELKQFSDYNAIEISSSRIEFDIQRLISAISKILKKPISYLLPVIFSIAIMFMIVIACVYLFFTPSNLQDHLNKGNQYLNTGYYEKAAEHFKIVTQQDPNNQQAFFGLKKISIHQMIIDSKSTDIYEKEIKSLKEKYPDDPHIDLLYAELFANTVEGISHYQQIIKDHPHLAEAYFGLGVIYQKKKNNKKAMEMYEKALEIAPYNIRYLTNKGDLAFQNKQYDDCIKAYKEISKMDKNVLLTYSDLIHALRMKGDMKKAAHYSHQLENLLSIKDIFNYPPNADIWFFTIQDHYLSLRDRHAKIAYIYYSIALTDILNNPDSKIEPKIQKACKAISQSTIKDEYLKKLIKFEAKQVYIAHSSSQNNINKFWKYINKSD